MLLVPLDTDGEGMRTAVVTADRHAYVRLNGSCVLRLSVRHDDDGRPSWLAMTRGLGVGPDFRPDFMGVFTVPVSALPDVRNALSELDG